MTALMIPLLGPTIMMVGFASRARFTFWYCYNYTGAALSTMVANIHTHIYRE